MQLEEAQEVYLTAHAGLSALISNRFYPEKLPDNPTYPAVTYRRVSGASTYAHDGDSQLERARMQYDVWASNYTSAKSVRAQLDSALSAYQGVMGGASGVTVHGVFKRLEIDAHDPETKRRRIIMDFEYFYKE